MKAQSPSVFMNVEMLKDLREHARLFLKLDFAYIAAIGAVIATLKFGRGEILEIGAQWNYFGYGFLLLVCFDAFVHSLIFAEWFSAAIGAGKPKSAKLFMGLLHFQAFLHLNLVALVVVGALAFSKGDQEARTHIYARVQIQDEVESFVSQTGRAPKTLSELILARPLVQTHLGKLDGEEVKIEATGLKSYKITYAGQDKTWDTNDDEVATQELRLREIWDRFNSHDKTRGDDRK